MRLEECLRNNQRENDRGIAGHLNRLRFDVDLAPRDGFVRTGPRVTAVELLSRVDVDRVLGAVAHKIGVASVVLHHAAAKNNPVGDIGLIEVR